MRVLFACSLALSTAIAGAANAEGVFQEDPSSIAAVGLNLIGLAIIFLTAASSLGALAAGVWMSLRNRSDRRSRRR
ncbi:MAG: hypothetical protein ACYC8V_02455 [Caulobacteraceae bacterium]